MTFHMIFEKTTIGLLIEAHQKARETIKKLNPKTKVGLSMALSDIQSIPGGEALAEARWQLVFGQFVSAVEEDDFFGLQNYTREVFGPKGQVRPIKDAELTQMKYEYAPDALGKVIRKVAQQLSLPIFVTEHGVATDDDSRRIDFIHQGLEGIRSCLEEGIELIGYLHWSTFDNFEWNSGYAMKFGLIEVDRATQERKAKESAKYLGHIAQINELL